MLDFSWVTELSAWTGLGTLVLLEVVLGVDNLVFISILASRLPEEEKKRAFYLGLALALLMRLVLLGGIAWLTTLTEPLFSLAGRNFSARDLILMAGGVFLLLKGTLELHERLEGGSQQYSGHAQKADFKQVVIQIIVLDAVFSLDSIITSVGMVDYVSMMMLAVVAAMIVMVTAAGPLLRFVERHPTVIVLCLGFLLMIGLGLLTDGLGYHIPKGYLYAAVLFSLLVEACNQLALRNRRKRISVRGMRESTARAVLGLLGGAQNDSRLDAQALATDSNTTIFAPEERDMVLRVLRLSGRTARFVMTPRRRVQWLDASADIESVRRFAENSSSVWLPVRRGGRDEILGVMHIADLLADCGAAVERPWTVHIRPAPTVFEHTPLVDVLENYRDNLFPLAFVRDEYGSVVGIITPAELLSVISGSSEAEADVRSDVGQNQTKVLILHGNLTVDEAVARLGIDTPARSRSATLAGLMLERLGHIPVQGERVRLQQWDLEITGMDGRRIDTVRATRHE